MAFRKIGSLWKSDQSRGAKHVLRGSSEREAITIPPNAKLMIFPNDKGDNPKRPDYRLVIAEDEGLPETPSGGSYQPPPDESDLPF
jgi:hypothetical protein